MAYDAFYFHEFPSHDDVLREGARWLVTTAGEKGLEPVVVAPLKTSFKDNEILRALAGHVRTESASTIKKAWGMRPCAVLAAWPDPQTLRTLDGLPNVNALCVVPWVEQDVAIWLSARQPTDLLGKAQQRPAPRLDPVIEVALEHLTNRVNLSTGITHPSDRDAAVLTFQALRKGRYSATEAELEAWALAHDWTPDGARDLSQRGAKILAGGRAAVKYGGALRADALKQWKAEAAKRS
jgi:hypothetical protein